MINCFENQYEQFLVIAVEDNCFKNPSYANLVNYSLLVESYLLEENLKPLFKNQHNLYKTIVLKPTKKSSPIIFF